jgi:hypothetical protein
MLSLEEEERMRLLMCAALMACAAAPVVPATVPHAGDAPPAATAAAPSQRRAPPRAPKRKSMPKTNQTPAPTGGPILDGPNRMEIDPADIPPSQRPRDPNVDDRTRIPSEVSPDDMAPAARKPKKRRP